MADDKRKRGAADRRQVAGGEGYEVSYFARKHGISREGKAQRRREEAQVTSTGHGCRHYWLDRGA